MKTASMRSYIPACSECPLDPIAVSSVPATSTTPPEPGGYLCPVTDEFIPEDDAPDLDNCKYIKIYELMPQSRLMTALQEDDKVYVVHWLVKHIPPALLREAFVRANDLDICDGLNARW